MSHRTPSTAARPPSTIAIVGASARAAAFSALRAGLQPWCADLFADVDLQAVCPVVQVQRHNYPQGLRAILQSAPDVPWIYTGALENRPGLVRQLGTLRHLWGNGPLVLRRVRQPWLVEGILREAGLACPRTWNPRRPLPSRGRWLVKPLAGAGGLGITPWQGRPVPSTKAYVQECIDGEPCSAVYVGRGEGEGRGAMLLGVTRQLIGQPWLFASGFQYCGSIGPLRLSAATATRFAQLGDVCAARLGLRGLFGVDCILRDEVPYPVEINPRYPASVEVLEQALGIQALALHCRAFMAEPDPLASRPPAQTPAIVGKAILFARDDLTVPAQGPWVAELAQSCLELRAFADLPHAGQVITGGQPVMTVFARADSLAACLEALQRAARALTRHLWQ
jgi:predicted ATP-grasp superfamily ATP-dependent carboligase